MFETNASLNKLEIYSLSKLVCITEDTEFRFKLVTN